MSTDYSDQKIREIMGKVNGQGKLAEQAIRTLITRDAVFLQSLVSPYLGGIVAHGIERARKQTGMVEPKPQPMPQAKAQAKSSPGVSTSAMNGLMDALAKGFEKNSLPQKEATKTGGVSKAHLDAIAAMAVKNLGKKN